MAVTGKAGVRSSVRSAPKGFAGATDGEDAWIDVIQKMDQVYSDLVESQTLLEVQNAQLVEAQSFIGSVLAAMSDVLIVCDLEGCIQRVNRALEVLTGRSEASLLRHSLGELIWENRFDPVSKFQRKARRDEQLSDCEVMIRTADGKSAPLAINCTPLHEHSGRLVGFVLVGRPIGELRRAYRELGEAHDKLTRTQQKLVVSEKMAALGRLVAGVAHELNNPISFVFGNMHALKKYGVAITQYLSACDKHMRVPELEGLKKELKIDQILADISPLVEGTLEGAERVSDIVQDLRRFSSNQQEPDEIFDLAKLVRTAADWVAKTERVKPVIEFDVPEQLEMVGRRGPMHQILVNLIQNAADVLAGSEAPRIQIACHADAKSVSVTVADNGAGIAPHVGDKIFEPFFTTKPIGQGTGLGLYISYGMAQKLGGTLTAANRPEGGAIFTLTVPLK